MTKIDVREVSRTIGETGADDRTVTEYQVGAKIGDGFYPFSIFTSEDVSAYQGSPAAQADNDAQKGSDKDGSSDGGQADDGGDDSPRA